MKKVLLILITLISVCAQGQTYKISQLAVPNNIGGSPHSIENMFNNLK